MFLNENNEWTTNYEFLLNRGEYFKYNVGINSEISLDDFKVNCLYFSLWGRIKLKNTWQTFAIVIFRLNQFFPYEQLL